MKRGYTIVAVSIILVVLVLPAGLIRIHPTGNVVSQEFNLNKEINFYVGG